MEHHVVACLFCGGMDPNADSLLLQAAIAGGITAPWMLRDKLRAMIARVRGRPSPDGSDTAACPMPEEDSEQPPT